MAECSNLDSHLEELGADGMPSSGKLELMVDNNNQEMPAPEGGEIATFEREPALDLKKEGHRISTGMEIMPRSPLSPHLAISIGLCAVGSIVAGLGMLSLGIMLQQLMTTKGTRTGPALWWCSVIPLILGIYGLYSAIRRRRKGVYWWGMLSVISLFTQVAVMGAAGNFTTSNYDVLPNTEYVQISTPDGDTIPFPVCEQRQINGTRYACFCQDYTHGVYSEMNLPGITYQTQQHAMGVNIKWRESPFVSCADVKQLCGLYFTFMAFLCCHTLMCLVGLVLAFMGSVCASHDTQFHTLMDDDLGEDEEMEEKYNEENDSKIFRGKRLQTFQTMTEMDPTSDR